MQNLEEALESIPEVPQDIPPMQQLSYYWPVIVLLLTFAKIFTGKKADKRINEIIDFGSKFF